MVSANHALGNRPLVASKTTHKENDLNLILTQKLYEG